MATKTESELKKLIDTSHHLFIALNGLPVEDAVEALDVVREWIVKRSLKSAQVFDAETAASDVDTFIDIAKVKGFLL